MESAEESVHHCECGHECKAHNHETEACDCTDCHCEHCAGRQANPEEPVDDSAM